MTPIKHTFGTPVICALCGEQVASVWAVHWEDAQAGKGVCDACLAVIQAPAPEAKPASEPGDMADTDKDG